jgi:hypothetical protein
MSEEFHSPGDGFNKAQEKLGFVEPTVPLSEMFEFIKWKDDKGYEHFQNGFYLPKYSSGAGMITESDLWNKYQEEKNKQK